MEKFIYITPKNMVLWVDISGKRGAQEYCLCDSTEMEQIADVEYVFFLFHHFLPILL